MALGLPDDPVKQKKLLIGVLPLLILGGYWYFLHGDYRAEVDRMSTRLERLEQRNAQARARAPQSQELEERLAQFERHIARLEQLVPRGEEVAQILDQINGRAVEVGVDLARFTPGRTEAGQHYNRRVFEMTVIGSYHNIGQFLAEIGSLPRIVTATDLRLIVNQARSRGGTTMLEAWFRIETYVLPDRPQQAAGATAGA